MNNSSLFLLGMLLLIVSACQKTKKITNYYDDGQIKETYYVDINNNKQGEYIKYFPSGNISYNTYYFNNKLIDTIYHYKDDKSNKIGAIHFFIENGLMFYRDYHENGSVRQQGHFADDEQRIGIWQNHDNNGNHRFTKEYKIIDGKAYTNQMWVTLPMGDTLTESVSIHKRFDKTQLKITDSIYCFFQIENSAFSLEDQKIAMVSVTLPKDYTQQNFKADFSNRPKDSFGLTEITGNTLLNIKSLDLQQKLSNIMTKIPKEAFRKTVAFYWKPKRTGKDTIRGYFTETISFIDKSDPANREKDSIRTEYTKEIYFDHPIEVLE